MFTLKKTLLNCLAFLICVTSAYTQSIRYPNRLSEEVKMHLSKSSDSLPNTYHIFDKINRVEHAREWPLVEGTQLLKLNKQLLLKICSSDQELIQLELPYHGSAIQLSLFRFKPFSDQLSVNTPQGTFQIDESIRFYRGIVKGDDQSLVSLSIHLDGIMGMLSSEELGNMILAHHSLDPDIHVLYEEDHGNATVPFNCEALVVPGYAPKFSFQRSTTRSQSDGCVNIFLEASYSIYQNFNNDLDQVINFLTGLFNQVSTIYANEDVQLVLSDLYIWTENDPYDHDTSNKALESFMNAPLKGNGHLRHLLDMAENNNGGRAYVDVLCDKVLNVGYSNIKPYYFGSPIYSWSVNVIAHELGHGLGAFHTQDCIWGPDNCSAIDGCAEPNPDVGCGSCLDATIPDKGTIMSYCHTKGGIDFTLGFGKEPGDLIRNRIAEANCVSPCGSEPAGICQLSVQDVILQPSTCGEPNGSIEVNVSGASGSETYDLGNGPQADKRFEGLTPGVYHIVVKDGISCERSVEAIIELQSEAPGLQLITSNASCMGRDGTLLIVPSGGTKPYSYKFDGIITRDSFYSNVAPGEYEVSLIDSAGCVAGQKLSIYEDSPPKIEAALKSTHCGLNNGELHLVCLGGMSPFHFDVLGEAFDTSISASSASIDHLAPGMYQITVQDSQGCDDSVVVNIDHSEGPSVALTVNPASCQQPNGSIDIQTSGGNSPYRYFLADEEHTSPLINQLLADTYTVKVIDVDQCEVVSRISVPYDSSFVAPKVPPIVDLCEGETIHIEGEVPEPAKIWWSLDDSLIATAVSKLAINEPGNYQATAVYSEECRLSTELQVIARSQPQVDLTSIDTICAGQYFEFPEADSTYSYRWSNGNEGPRASFTSSGNYWLEVTSGFGCRQNIKLDITVIQPVNLTTDQENLVICPGDEVPLSVFGADFFTWISDDLDPLSGKESYLLVAPSRPMVYHVIGMNSCFRDSIELNVNFFPAQDLLPPDTTILTGIPFEIGLPPATDVQWKSDLDLSCEICVQTTVYPVSSGDLYVSYTDQNGCFRQDSVSLSVKDLDEILPSLVNVITPNGDNRNDYLSFNQPAKFQRMKLQVFAQDGSILFESNDYTNDWTGTIEGDPLPEGVYFYALTLQYQGQTIQIDSDLTIIRD